jgi:hypothetical protein
MDWIFLVSSMFFGTFPGGHMVSPKRPKQHLKHWGEARGGRGWQVKSPRIELFLQLQPSFDPKIKWWIFKILLHVELFPNKVEWFNFTTPKRALNSKTPTVVNGPRFVCIAQNVIDPNMQLVTLGVVHLKFFGKKFLHLSHLKCYLV